MTEELATPEWSYWEGRDAWVWDLGDDSMLMVVWAGSSETWMFAHVDVVDGRPQGPIRVGTDGFDSAASAIRAAEYYERRLF